MTRNIQRWRRIYGTTVLIISVLSLLHFSACTNSRQSTTPSNFGYNYSDTNTRTPTPSPAPNTDYSTLFDGQTKPNETSSGTSHTSTVTPDENSCLTSDWAWGLDPTKNSSCFSISPSGINYNQLFTMGLQSFGNMDICVQLAMSAAPKQGASQQEIEIAFISARMAMVRCFRRLNSWQQGSFQWSPYQNQAYGYTDDNLWQLLNSFQAGH